MSRITEEANIDVPLESENSPSVDLPGLIELICPADELSFEKPDLMRYLFWLKK